MGSLFLLLSPINLYTHFALFWMFSGRDIASLPVSAENFLPLWIALLILYAAVIIHALHWLFTISAEIQASREIKLQVPSVWYYILALILPIGGYFFSRGFAIRKQRSDYFYFLLFCSLNHSRYRRLVGFHYSFLSARRPSHRSAFALQHLSGPAFHSLAARGSYIHWLFFKSALIF